MIIAYATLYGKYNYDMDLKPPFKIEDVYKEIKKEYWNYHRYLNDLKVFLQSLSETNNNIPVTIYVLNADVRAIYHLKLLYNNLKIIDVNDVNTKNINVQKSSNDRNKISDYSITLKAKYIQNILKNEHYKYVIYVDGDIIIRKNLDTFIENINKTKPVLQILNRDRKLERFKFNAGVIGMSNTAIIRKMVDSWVKLQKQDFGWYSDQRTLFQAYNEYKADIELIGGDEGWEYNDWYFYNNSIIWHSKDNHRKEIKWLNEYLPLLYRANKLYDKEKAEYELFEV